MTERLESPIDARFVMEAPWMKMEHSVVPVMGAGLSGDRFVLKEQ